MEQHRRESRSERVVENDFGFPSIVDQSASASLLSQQFMRSEEDADLQYAIQLSLIESSTETIPQSQEDQDFQVAWEIAISERASLFSPDGLKPCGYEPLATPREIRLLRLKSQPSDVLDNCSLVSVSLDSPLLPMYTTISYAWGRTFDDGSHLTEVLPCDTAVIKVTKNVRRALDSIYASLLTWGGDNHDTFMLIWIDSICINQANPMERNQQVAQMGEIFAKCNEVFIWLGDHSRAAKTWLNDFSTLVPHSDASLFLPKNELKLKREISMLSRPEKERLLQLLERSPVEVWGSWILMVRTLLASNTGGLAVRTARKHWEKPFGFREAYLELTQRSWFHRKWVVQEMAQTHRKRRYFLINNQLKRFAEIESGINEYSLQDAATSLGAKLSNKTLFENLLLYHDTQASEAHDHIYALLGLSNDVSWLTVDYNQSVESLYTDVAEHYVRNGNSIAVLALATSQRSSKDLPTWVPDWREPRQCDRSAMHGDAMKTLSSGDRRLWREPQAHAEIVMVSHESLRKGLRLKAWLVANCKHGGLSTSSVCRACKLLGQAEDSKRRGKQPWSWTARRQASVQQKWSAGIRQQFEVAIHSDEVLCLLENSALGFVLLPTGVDVDIVSATPTYRLEFCFQVDEEIGMSNWFSSALGSEGEEWICIV